MTPFSSESSSGCLVLSCCVKRDEARTQVQENVVFFILKRNKNEQKPPRGKGRQAEITHIRRDI